MNYYSDDYIKGQESFRNTVISHINGFQNVKYWREESEGYKALQELFELITDRYGGFMEKFKG